MDTALSLTDTAGEAAYGRIRRDIIFGTLSPGSRLRLDRLRTAYGVSVSTLREILSRLSSERFVVAEGQKGFEVAPVGQDNFREVAALRELLEGHALLNSFAHGDVEWEGRVVAAHHKLSRMEARVSAGDLAAIETWKRYDREFHAALISACGSAELITTHRRAFDHYLRYQMIAVIYRGEAACLEHRRLLDCALDRDGETALAVLRQHIRSCVDHTLHHGLMGE